MKHRILLALGLLPLLATAARAALSFDFQGDLLTTASSGNIGIPDGRVLFLVASTTDNIFANPTAGNFTAGSLWGGSSDDIVLWSFAANGTASTGTAGAMEVISPELTLSGNWTTGDHLAMFWFPTTTYVANGTVLSPGDTWGMFGFGSTGSDAINWVTPSDLTSLAPLLFYTPAGSIFGPGNDVASFGTIAVPEPAVYGVLIGSTALAVAAWRRRRR